MDPSPDAREPSSDPGRTLQATLGTALLGGAAAGAAWVAWEHALPSLFGGATDTRLTLLAEGALAVALGLRRDVGGGRGALAAWTIPALLTVLVAALSGPGADLLGHLGVRLDAYRPVTVFTRLLVGGVLIVPAGIALGMAIRRLALSPAGLPLATAGAAWTVALGRWALLGDVSPLVVGSGAGALLVVSGVAASRREPVDGQVTETTLDKLAPALTGAAVGVALAGFARLAPRVMVPVFGNELPGIPLPEATLATGLAVGATVGAAVAFALPAVAALAAVPVALAGTAAFGVLVVGDYGALPERFVALASQAADYDAVLASARAIVLPRAGGLGVLLGLSVTLLAAGASRDARGGWVARAGAGVGAGVVAGTVLARPMIAVLGIPGALSAVAIASVLPAVVALRALPFAMVGRILLSVVAIGITAGAILSAPVVDREALLVRRANATKKATQKSWTAIDRDGDLLGVHVRRRGHERRLLVNGRFEMAGVATRKSHGLLTHLPLGLRGGRGRALVVGTGTGWSVGSAAAHPVALVDCFEVDRELVSAARMFGPGAERAMSLIQLDLRIGDPGEMLARAPSYDVILLQPSGAWTERSAAACTREFLALARDKLTAGGILTHWIPGDSLTREGTLILFATYCDVFPQVEVWAGQGGDLVLLAKAEPGRHDFTPLARMFEDPVASRAMEASWIATPETLLSQFLLDDAAVRKLCAGRSVHSVRNGELARREAARRVNEPTVNPVPGLTRLRTDVLERFDNLPDDEAFREAVRRAIRARDLEREALERESRGEEFEAARIYEEALAANPNDGEVRRAFAMLREQMGIRHARRDEATAAYGYLRQAVEIDTTYVNGFANLGHLLTEMENYDFAISVLGRAAVMAPEDDLVHRELGGAWVSRGYADKALPFFKRATELNPLNVDAAVDYVECQFALKGEHADRQAALEYLKDYLALEPDNQQLIDRIARIRGRLQELGLPDEE